MKILPSFSLLFLVGIFSLYACQPHQHQQETAAVSEVVPEAPTTLVADSTPVPPTTTPDETPEIPSPPVNPKEASIPPPTTSQVDSPPPNKPIDPLVEKALEAVARSEPEMEQESVSPSPGTEATSPNDPVPAIIPTPTEEIVKETAFSHAAWDALLKKYVSASGKVNYKGFKADKAKLQAYLDQLSANAPASSWSRNERLAFGSMPIMLLPLNSLSTIIPSKVLPISTSPGIPNLFSSEGKTTA